MTATVSTTGSVSSAGIGSGLDVDGIISKLMQVESAPLTHLQTVEASIQTKISAFGSIKSMMASLRDAASVLTKPSTWSATTGTSSDSTGVTVSASTSAKAGSYAVNVTNLAAAQSVATSAFSSGTATLGAGTLHIDLGTWATDSSDVSSFTAKSGNAGIDIAISDTDTMADVRDKINASGAGVTASILTDATGPRLVMTSKTTGLDNGFRITTGDAALAGLAYDPAGGSTGTTLTQSAVNANATINGLNVTSATNSLSNVVDGMTINLLKATTTPIQITVAQDNTSITNAIKSFVAAYNSLTNLIADDTKYDATTSTGAVLQGDSTAVSLQRQMRDIIGSSSNASSVFSTLSDIGLEVQGADANGKGGGTLTVNDSKLTNALGNLPELKKLFANSDSTGATQSGYATRLRQMGDAALSVDGLLLARTTGLSTSLERNKDSQDAMDTRLAATESRLRAQYTALDTQMATLSTLSNYITQQIANWNKSTG
jgi:flagellar hook-associated protein 2